MRVIPRERALRAIELEEPDRVPLEGVAWGEWSFPFLQRLLVHLGLGEVEIPVKELGEKQDLLAERLGIDFRAVKSDPPVSFRRRAVFNPLFHVSWGIPVGPEVLEDEWGVRRTLNATRMQSRIVYHPLRGRESLDGYDFPDPEAPGRFDAAEMLVRNWGGRYAVSASWGGDSFFCQAWYLRGFRDLILDMHSNRGFAERLLDELQKFFLAVGKRLAEMGVDIVCIADDIAMQRGMIFSPHLWRRYFKPRMRTIVQTLKRRGVHILFHSDGDCSAIIPDLLEIGVDILNPVQPECMDPAEVKRVYGERLVLSGTISIQKTLPEGTPEDVRDEVVKRMETCGRGGGLIISPSNQVLLDTSVENFLAVYEAARKYGRYPVKP